MRWNGLVLAAAICAAMTVGCASNPALVSPAAPLMERLVTPAAPMATAAMSSIARRELLATVLLVTIPVMPAFTMPVDNLGVLSTWVETRPDWAQPPPVTPAEVVDAFFKNARPQQGPPAQTPAEPPAQTPAEPPQLLHLLL